jgi:hypothetical protein
VNAQGVLVLRAPFGARIDAQIDGRDTVTGRLTSGCSYQMVWQKEGKWTLSAEAALDKGHDNIAAAEPGQILVPGLAAKQPSLG